MNWSADPKRQEAMSSCGYRITWAENKHGTWFNGYSPAGRCIEASYDKEKVKAACVEHLTKAQKVTA